MAIWDAIKELERLQRKAARGKEICDSDTFVVRAALKEKGWEGLVCEEAISRGYREARGEEVTSIPSWYAEEAISRFEERDAADHIVPTPPEVQGSETPEEEQAVPGRVFNLLGDMGAEEPKEQEKVREEGPEVSEHVRYLNGIHIMRTGNPQWEDFLWTYMEKFGLKPSDMYGLLGPRPWKDDPLWGNIEDEEIPEPIKKEETMEKAYNEGLPSMSEYDMARKEQDPPDARPRVYVGDEVGWLCKVCNRVWGLDELTCTICKQPGGVLHGDALRTHMEQHLGKKKDDKDLAIIAMHKALGISVEYPEGVQVISILGAGDEEDDRVQCEHCGGNDYLECDCCLECESEECTCCDNCARFPCQCDTEECPICHNNIVIGAACPHGCDSDIKELRTLYEDVKNSKDLGFQEKVKFMSLLKEKMGLAHDDPDPMNIRAGEEGEEPWVDDDNPEEE